MHPDYRGESLQLKRFWSPLSGSSNRDFYLIAVLSLPHSYTVNIICGAISWRGDLSVWLITQIVSQPGSMLPRTAVNISSPFYIC